MGWLVALAVVLTLVGKLGAGLVAGAVGGFTRRQSFNAGVALVAHGEFTIILAQLASDNPLVSTSDKERPRRLRGPLRPRDGDDRDRPHEGVEASRPHVVPCP